MRTDKREEGTNTRVLWDTIKLPQRQEQKCMINDVPSQRNTVHLEVKEKHFIKAPADWG